MSAVTKVCWVKDTSFMFAQSLWRLLPPSRCPSMSRCVVPAPCRGRASPAPVEWEDVSPSWKWWQVTSWWTSQAGTSLSICSSHQTDCACTGRTAVGGFNKEKEKERERNIDNLVSSIVHTRAGYHFSFFDIDVNPLTQVRYHFNTKMTFFYYLPLKNINMFLDVFGSVFTTDCQCTKDI